MAGSDYTDAGLELIEGCIGSNQNPKQAAAPPSMAKDNARFLWFWRMSGLCVPSGRKDFSTCDWKQRVAAEMEKPAEEDHKDEVRPVRKAAELNVAFATEIVMKSQTRREQEAAGRQFSDRKKESKAKKNQEAADESSKRRLGYTDAELERFLDAPIRGADLALRALHRAANPGTNSDLVGKLNSNLMLAAFCRAHDQQFPNVPAFAAHSLAAVALATAPLALTKAFVSL